jgi:hypothetical protein
MYINYSQIAGFVFLTIGAVALFTFLAFAVWAGGRRKEREAFYKSETLRRITESSGEGAKQAIDLLREENRQQQIKSREGMKIGGLVCTGVGLGIVIFLWAKVGLAASLCGLIPAFIGVALLVYAYFLAAPLEEGPKA